MMNGLIDNNEKIESKNHSLFKSHLAKIDTITLFLTKIATKHTLWDQSHTYMYIAYIRK